ncbi:MAG: FecR domain-containing protein [Deltaproteobacteria bacterium]|nr:FecR domain-containing protein [Deltaproteobacteria bacterium]
MKTSVYLRAAWALTLALTLVLFGAELTYAQEAGPKILSVAGKAEILERGRRTPARRGHTLQPGQTIELVGGGEVSLAMDNDRIKVKVVDGSSVRYDGYVPANSQPWSAATPAVRQASSGEMAPQFSAQKGQMEVEVAPGQQLRIVSPLILAAVRGTKFTVTVDFDGTSKVDTSEGRVATYGRNGEIRLATPTQSAVVTAKEYGAFLESQGARIPRGGTWRDVPAATQERVDSETVGAAFQPGGDILVAVLANPNASPTSGVQALALDVSSAEPGSIFAMETTEPSSVNTAARVLPVASEIDPQSTLLDEGLPDIQAPPSVTGPNMAYVIGEFNMLALFVNPSDVYFNKFVFDLDLDSGAITWAGFDVSYLKLGRRTSFWSGGGTGQLNLNTLAFHIGNFDPLASEYEEDSLVTTMSKGYLNSGTVMYGTFTSPLNFVSTSTGGQVDLAYTTTNGVTPTVMPASVSFAGLLREKPLLDVEGSFSLPTGVGPVSQNMFSFALNANNGIISDGEAKIDYNVGGNFLRLELEQGTGALTSSSFSVSFPAGLATWGPTPGSTAINTPSLNGGLSSSDPVAGDHVTGGSLSFTYASSVPSFMPNAPIPIDSGDVKNAGR